MKGAQRPFDEFWMPADIVEPSGQLKTSQNRRRLCAQLAIGVIARQICPEA